MDFEFITNMSQPSAPLEEQPTTVLARWAVMQVSTCARFLVGERTDVLNWRRSTPIVVFLPAERVMVMTSGRRYLLKGPPAVGSADTDLIQTVLEGHGFREAIDVTETYCAAMLAAAH